MMARFLGIHAYSIPHSSESLMGKRRRRSDDYDDDYDEFEDDYDDDYEDDCDEAPRRRRSSSSRGRRGGSSRTSSRRSGSRSGGSSRSAKSKKKSQGGVPGWVLPVGIGAGLLLVVGVIAIVAVAMSGGGDDSSDNNHVADNTGSPSMPTGDGNQANANGGGGGQNFAPPPGAAQQASYNSVPQGKFWVQLSNLSVSRAPGGFGAAGDAKKLTVTYRVVSGRPDPSTRYRIRILTDTLGGSVTGRAEGIDLEVNNFANPNGTVSDTVRFSFTAGSQFQAFVFHGSDHDPKLVSGRLKQGQGSSSSSPPQTAAQAAGGAASGFAIALANARRERGFAGQEVIAVDYEVTGNVGGKRLRLIIDSGRASDSAVDVTSDIRQSKTGTLKVRAFGIFSSAKLYIESGGGGIIRTGREKKESNTVSF